MIPTNNQTSEFIALWTASSRQVYAYILMMLPHWADADEAYQETSRVLWEKFDQFEIGSDFTAWACRIAHFKVLDVRARRKRGPLSFSDEFLDVLDREVSTAQKLISPRHAAMLDCLAKLAESDRDLIYRRYRDGMTIATLAAQVGRSANALYKTLNRLHEALYHCIERTLRAEGRA